MSNQDYLKVAIKAAKEAAPIFKKYFGKAGKTTAKNGDPRDLVTKADLQIERLIRKTILKTFPKSKIIGEEYSQSKLVPNDIVWLVDPIDGTTNFIQGLSNCAISIALWQGQQPLLGLVYNPLTGQLFSAQKGKGAELNGKKIKVSQTKKIDSAFGGFGWGRDIAWGVKNFPKLLPKLRKIRTLGSTAMELCKVAEGMYDFQIQGRIKIWDFAAAAIILTESGGKITDFKGQSATLTTTQILASNGKIHKQLLKIVK
ncbi:MAG: inositol monophosphatase family protein [Patescibacteria group bacterium]